MPNNDWRTPAPFAIFPFGAGDDTPRVVIGTPADGVIPADLIAYYAAFGETIIAAIVEFNGLGPYNFQVFLLDGAAVPYTAFGTRDSTGVVSEAYRFFAFLGGPSVTSFAFHDLITQLMFRHSGSIQMTETSSIVLQDTTTLELAETSLLHVFAGSTVQIDTSAPYTIDGVSAARGLKTRTASNAATAAIGAVETVVMTTSAMTFQDGRAYEVLWYNRLSHSAAQIAAVRVRQTNLAGASLIFWDFQVTAGGITGHVHRSIVRRLAGAGDLSDNLVLTLRATAGTVTSTGAVDIVRYLEVRDVGDAADYPNEATI